MRLFTIILPLLVCTHLTLFSQNQLGSTICGDHIDGRFGESVAVSADGLTMAVTSTGFMDDKGMVRVFKYDGSDFNQVGQDLTGTSSGEIYGANLDLSDDGLILVISAPWYGTTAAPDRGKVDAFEFNTSSQIWEQLGNSLIGPSGTRLGIGVGAHSDGLTLITGQSIWPPPSSYQLYSYINNDWVKGEMIEAPGVSPSTYHQFSGDGRSVVVGIKGPNATDGVDVFELNGSQWTKKGESILVPFESGATTSSVSINQDGSIVAFSDQYARANGNFSGTTFIYSFVNGTWQSLGDPIHGTVADYLGNHVDLNAPGNRIAIHLSPNNVEGKEVNIYDFANNNWSLYTTLTAGGAFGRGMDLNKAGNIIAIGSPWDDCNGNDAGNVKVYELSQTSHVFSEGLKEIEIYPNPVNEHFQVVGGSKMLSIKIQDIQGKTIYTSSSNDVKQIDCSNWLAGIYFARVELENEFGYLKILKQ